MKKKLSLILAILMTLSLLFCACGNGSTGADSSNAGGDDTSTVDGQNGTDGSQESNDAVLRETIESTVI